MKENYALIVNPDTTIEEAYRWTEKYGVVIRPDQDLRKSTVIFSLNYEMIWAISERIRPVPSGWFGLPSDVGSFLFRSYGAATTFLAEHHLIIGYDHIDDVSK